MQHRGEKHFDKQAIVGLDSLKTLLLRAWNAVARKGGFTPFKTRDEALDFLVQ